MATQSHNILTPEDYLEQERRAEFRSEYLNGEAYAMAGTSLNHALIVTNLNNEISGKLAGRDCKAVTTEVRLEIPQSRLFTYPDVMVFCGRIELRQDVSPDTVRNPTLIVEVLPSSTQDYDRGTKFDYYRALSSFREYLLVDQKRVLVEQRIRGKREDREEWLSAFVEDTTDVIMLESVGAAISVASIYRGIEFD